MTYEPDYEDIHIRNMEAREMDRQGVKVPVHNPNATWGMRMVEGKLMLVLKTPFGETMTIEADFESGNLIPHDEDSAELLARYFGDD